jgi:membrane associated rhomboid family serine protease
MGIADRDYHRSERRGGGFMAQLTPVVKWILVFNVGIYVLDLILEGPQGQKMLRELGAFSVGSAVFQGKIWEFVTFQFLHGSIGHLLFNSIGLFFFGPWMERWWGSRNFLWFYLLCGIGGGAFFTLLTLAGAIPNGMHSMLVGASAGIFGILIGVAIVAPNLRVMLLIPPIELSMRQLAIALLVIAVGSIALRLGGNEGGEAGHLGGAIAGFILMKFPWLLGHERDGQSFQPRAFKRRADAKIRPRSRFQSGQDSEVDKILDKISRDGFQSLTEAEKETLRKASERHQS